jgi:medium-chain acyl-[acyl-carrier-protein] hydrolase
MFRSWSTDLPSEIEVWPIQLPGRESLFRMQPYTELSRLISALLALLYPYYLSKPFAIFGHSLGALVGFEFARSLQTLYRVSPAHLFVSGRTSPATSRHEPPLHRMDDSSLIHQLRLLGATPEALLASPEMRSVWLPILRADLAMDEQYVFEPSPNPRVSVPITAFGGRADPKVGLAQIELWSEHTTQSFKVRSFPGDHFFINNLRSDVLRAVAQDLRSFRL